VRTELFAELTYHAAYDSQRAIRTERPEHAGVVQELDDRLRDWMAHTGDPLLDGPVPLPPGAVVNDPAGISAREPFLAQVT
jgi:hypothetical protein